MFGKFEIKKKKSFKEQQEFSFTIIFTESYKLSKIITSEINYISETTRCFRINIAKLTLDKMKTK